MKLQGQHVVIIGASSGIGLATASIAKAAGAKVTMVARGKDKLKLAAQKIGVTDFAVADITDRQSVEALFHGMDCVDHLVVLAGGIQIGRLTDADPDQLMITMQERIAGPLYAVKAVMPIMPETGSIVLTGGMYADSQGAAGTSVISAAVRGIEALARSLALELKPVRVNVIAPGMIETPLFDNFGSEGRAMMLKWLNENVPVGRAGRPDDVADAILFLLTNEYMNCEVLHVDGGLRFADPWPQFG